LKHYFSIVVVVVEIIAQIVAKKVAVDVDVVDGMTMQQAFVEFVMT
jgi:hypothetical protein